MKMQGKDSSAPISGFTRIFQIRQCSLEQANHNLPVEVQGVVTYWDPATLELYVQDESDGVFVAASTPDLPLSAGRWVQIRGVTSGGESTRVIAHPQIKLLPGKTARVEPRSATVHQLLTGSEDARWVTMEGFVQQATDRGGQLTLWLRAGGQKVQVVFLPHPSGMDPADIVHARVRIRGVCQTAAKGDWKRETTRLLVNSQFEDLEVVSHPKGSPSVARECRIADLTRFIQSGLPDYPVRISGMAEGDSSESITLRDSSGAIQIYPCNPVFTGLGYPTQVEGFLETNAAGMPVLADATVTQMAACKPQRYQYDKNWQPSAINGQHEIITDLKALRELSEDEALAGYPAHFVGTVTWLSRDQKNFTLQSLKNGLFLDMEEGFPEGFEVGSLVDVTGYCGRGSFAPFIFGTKVRIVGQSGLPSPWAGNPSDLYSGVHDGRWIELEGIVRSPLIANSNEVFIGVASAAIKYHVRFPEAVDARFVPGVDAKVRIRGVCNVLSRERQALDFEVLVVDPSQLQEIRPPTPQNELPLGEIRQLFSSLAKMSSGHRVRIRGAVTLSENKELFYIGDGANGLRLYPNAAPAFQCGDRIEAIGFPAMGEARVAVLEDADVLLLEHGKPIEPLLCQFTKTIDPGLDGRLISVKLARLVEKHRRDGSIQLLMEAEGQVVFEARLADKPVNRAATSLEIGSHMDLTGICKVQTDTSGNPRSLSLLMRGAKDIENVALPPIKWTPRLLNIIGLCALAMVASLLWLFLLRRRVGRQTEIIKRQLEHKTALEHQYRQLVDNANDLIFTFDAQGCFTSINPACERVTGYSRDEALGMDVFKWLAPENQRRIRDHMASGADPEISAPYAVDILTKSGRRVTLDWSTRTLLVEGRFAGMQGIARDITERRHLEEQLHQARKMESVGQLAAGVAHDFNNIMTVILGHGDLLSQHALGPEAMESCQQVVEAAQRAADLTRQLLAFSRKQLMQPRPIDLNILIEDLGKMLSRLLGEHVALQFEFGARLPAIQADRGMIEQVLLNLCINARDAMPNGGTLKISTHAKDIAIEEAQRNPEGKSGSFVCLGVEDSGCGMDKATLDRIFEPFFTTKEVGKGTGLGLASAYGIVKQHEGWIQVASKPGEGSRFEILLPASQAGACAISDPAPPAALKGGRQVVLVVEDETPLRNLVERILTQSDFLVIAASSGKEALALWERQSSKPDLLLTDLVMPGGVSGQELARRLRREKPDLKILFTSGYSQEQVVQNADMEKDCHFLPKPYLPSKLAQIVNECLMAGPLVVQKCDLETKRNTLNY
jgi:PAS domain S-box-containing protein